MGLNIGDGRGCGIYREGPIYIISISWPAIFVAIAAIATGLFLL